MNVSYPNMQFLLELNNEQVWPLCDQAEETIQHILVSCVFSHQIWALVLQRLGCIVITPQPSVGSFSSLWSNARYQLPKELKCCLPCHSDCMKHEMYGSTGMTVFNGAQQNITALLQPISNECVLWCFAGASELQRLLIQSLHPAT
jgi:hypothetical protein